MENTTKATKKVSPGGLASTVLDQFWNGIFPVNPIAIANKLGLKVYEDKSLTKSGELRHKDKDDEESPLAIYVRDRTKESLQRMRFTVAHELGHYLLGHGPSNRVAGYDPNWGVNEIDANTFAANLLMPASHVIDMAFIKCIDFQSIANKMLVSRQALAQRMRELGLVS